jgi:N-acetylmuramoyl-L-alanine amidase
MKIITAPTDKYGDRKENATPSLLILHSMGCPVDQALNILTGPEIEASAHYYIPQDGTVYQIVPEDKRAWHAGRGRWCDITDINSHSIGIELGWSEQVMAEENEESVPGPFTPAQMESLTILSQQIMAKWNIRPENVLGHSDVDPVRKRDPGEKLDWQALARHKIGIWPENPPTTSMDNTTPIATLLARYGYKTDDLAAAIRAFQRHFRPHRLTGLEDDETRQILCALLAQVGR